MRDRAEWMNPSDDVILELLRDHGNLTPQAIENVGGPSVNTAYNRLPILRRAGLVEHFADTEGLYQLTDEGRAYLNEDLDASTLSPEDGDESDE